MTISVLTLNLWNDSGPWKERADGIRSWLDRLEPDLIGFQEVLRGDGLDLAAEVTAGRGYHLDFARASWFWKDRSVAFGNAVASRWPIVEREELALPGSGDGETRVALSVTVEGPPGPIAFTTTHLNWKLHHGAVRERQIVAVCSLVLRRRPRGGFPPVLVGDFNSEPESAEMRYATGLQSLEGRSMYLRDAWREAGGDGDRTDGSSDGSTWSNRNPYARPALEPDRRIDYVLVGPPRPDGLGLVESCAVVCDRPEGEVWPSDHFGVYARIHGEPLAAETAAA